MTAEQTAFRFPPSERRGAAGHVAGASSAAARAMLERVEMWPGGALVITGPTHSGKTALISAWLEQRNGRLFTARDLRGAGDVILDAAAVGPVAIDDMTDGEAHDSALMSVIDAARAGRAFGVVFASRVAPVEWPTLRADLRSRLAALASVELTTPDDEELGEVLRRMFEDRGVNADQALIGYLVRRIEPSFPAAAAIVDEVDRLALEGQKRVSRALARAALARLGAFQPGRAQEGEGDGGDDDGGG